MNFSRFCFCSILTSCISFSVCSNDYVEYSVPRVNWEPYWIISDQNVSGVFSDLMKELDRRLDYNLKASVPLPVKRANWKFDNGGTVIECCINIAWRDVLDSEGTTLWTETVLDTAEVLVFPIGQGFPASHISDLEGKSIATILGYGYLGGDKFIRHDSQDNIAQFREVARGLIDAAIIDQYELRYMLKHEPRVQSIAGKFELGPTISQSALKMRIHSSRPELLSPVNRAIKEMKSDGTVRRLLKKYIND